jgi:hypothetical protein
MNRSQFFQTVKLARATVEVVQEGNKGYKLTAFVQHEEEERTEIVLQYQDEPRYFKGFKSVVDLLRHYQVLNFTTRLDSKDIVVKKAPAKKAPAKKTSAGKESAPATA